MTDASSSSTTTQQQQPEQDVAATTTNTVVSSEPDETKVTKNNKYQVIAESVTRITLAGFAGSLNGLALERRQLLQQDQPAPAPAPAESTATSTSNTKVPVGRRRHPPSAMASKIMSSQQQRAKSNLPITWALSCMVFVTLLETCRVSSPMSKLLDSLSLMDDDNDYETVSENDNNDNLSSFLSDIQVQRTALVSFGDYTLGGTMAGLAGSLARRRPPPAATTSSSFSLRLPQSILKSGRRPLVIWGLAAGMGLGMVAGVFQAGISVADLYLHRQQQAAVALQQKQENDNQQ